MASVGADAEEGSMGSLPASAAELAWKMQKAAGQISKASELSAGTFLSKAADSLALSLSTVSDGDDEESSQSSRSDFVRSQTWPDVKDGRHVEKRTFDDPIAVKWALERDPRCGADIRQFLGLKHPERQERKEARIPRSCRQKVICNT
eukprot:g28955.t1